MAELSDLDAELARRGVSTTTADPAIGITPDHLDAELARRASVAASPQSTDSLLPAAPYDATDAAVHGMTLGLSDAGRAALMAGGRYLRGDTPGFDYSQAATEIQRGRDAYSNQAPFASLAANLAGGVAGAGGAAAQTMVGAGPLAAIAKGALSGGVMGGVQGAADNNASVSDAVHGAETGGALGAAIGGGIPGVAAAGRTLAPQISPAAQTMRAAGIEPTPGAAAGGLPGMAENLLAKIPVLGAPVQAGRAAARSQFDNAVAAQAENFNRGAVNDALSHVGESLSPSTAIGHDAMNEMADKVSAAYQSAIPTAGGAFDPQAQREITNAVNNAKLLLPPERAKQFENFVQTKIVNNVQPTASGVNLPTLSGQAFKDAESDLGKEARTYLSGNSTADERKLGQAYQDLQGTLRDWLARVTPQNAADIQAANQAYAKMLRVQDAAARGKEGVFTPENLLAATKKYSGNTQYARGGALMQDFAENAAQDRNSFATAGKQALPTPSGSAMGHGAGIGTGIGAGVLGADIMERLMEHPSMAGVAAAALGYPALAGAYSNAGRGAINGMLAGPLARIPSPNPVSPFAAQLPGLLNPGLGLRQQ